MFKENVLKLYKNKNMEVQIQVVLVMKIQKNYLYRYRGSSVDGIIYPYHNKDKFEYICKTRTVSFAAGSLKFSFINITIIFKRK